MILTSSSRLRIDAYVLLLSYFDGILRASLSLRAVYNAIEEAYSARCVERAVDLKLLEVCVASMNI